MATLVKSVRSNQMYVLAKRVIAVDYVCQKWTTITNAYAIVIIN